MKQLITTLCFCSFALLSTAQNDRSQWKINTVSFGFGLERAYYGRMSLDEMYDLAITPSDLERDLSGLNSDARLATANGGFSSNIGFCRVKYNDNGSYADREIRLGVSIESPQEAMVSYKNEMIDTSIVYCSVQEAFNVGLGYHFKGVLWNRMYWSVGADASYGRTFNNQLIVLSGDYFGEDEHPSSMNELQRDDYSAKAVNRARLTLSHEFGVRLGGHFVLGMNYTIGGVAHFVENANTNYSLFWSPKLNFRFNFN